MKRINNKGYMIVEIIVASVIAMTIAYFMMDLVVKLKEKYDYVQNDTILMSDKTVITNEILGDLYNREIVCAKASGSSGYSIEFKFENNDNTENWLKLSFDSTDKKIIYEEKLKEAANYTIIYQKKLNGLLQVKSTYIRVESTNNIASFIINAETLTSTKNYGVNIILPVEGVCE